MIEIVKKLKNLKELYFFILLIIYEEIIFSVFAFEQFPSGFIYILLFSIPIGIVFDLLTSICKKNKANTIISYIIVCIFSIMFAAHFIYNKIYQSIISMYSFSNGAQVFQFYDTIIGVIKDNVFKVLLFLLPIVILIVLNVFKKLTFNKTSGRNKAIKFGVLVVVQIIATIIVNFSNGNGIYTDKKLYNESNSLLLTAKRFGICTTMRLDFKRLVFNNNDDVIKAVSMVTNAKPMISEDVEYNVIEIDFDSLAEAEEDEVIQAIHKYMAYQEPSEKNEYTGMFEGKNLIVFVAESFSNIAIREDLTPTLYKMYNEGFQFDNFYIPLYPVSTADGEYMTDTSLMPKEGVWSISLARNIYIPYSYPNVFEKLGYTSNAYHDHTHTYYDRDKYMKAMGYDSFLANGTGLEERMEVEEWPSSDLEMINVTTDDYINNEKFLAYYMTVSGHLGYEPEGNVVVNKNWEAVRELQYTKRAKGYLASQMELDKAVEELINRLEKAGKLDDTVIMISGDHYPYGLTIDEVNELSTYERDETFEVHRMPFLIWNSQMEEPVKVEKIGSSLDILPTMLNLFGVEYDSRLLMGRDLLSDNNSLVIFSDRSFITDKGRYNAMEDTFIKTTDEEFDETEYISTISSVIQAKYQVSRMILERDYYRKIEDYL